MTDFLPVTLTSNSDRKQYSNEFKHQIVEATFKPNTSIAAIALLHGINANLLHKWRWLYRKGELSKASRHKTTLPLMQHAIPNTPLARLPLASTPTTQSANDTRVSRPNNTEASPSGDIELFFNDIRVLVHGTPDSQTLRNIIEMLR